MTKIENLDRTNIRPLTSFFGRCTDRARTGTIGVIFHLAAAEAVGSRSQSTRWLDRCITSPTGAVASAPARTRYCASCSPCSPRYRRFPEPPRPSVRPSACVLRPPSGACSYSLTRYLIAYHRSPQCCECFSQGFLGMGRVGGWKRYRLRFGTER